MVKQDGMREKFDRVERGNVLELNVNAYVVVSLTEDGKNILKEYYLSLLKHFDYKKDGYDSLEKYVEKVYFSERYKDGYCKMQLRELMNIFGKDLYMGSVRIPFKNNKIYFIESDNEDISKGAKKVSDETNEKLLDVLN